MAFTAWGGASRSGLVIVIFRRSCVFKMGDIRVLGVWLGGRWMGLLVRGYDTVTGDQGAESCPEMHVATVLQCQSRACGKPKLFAPMHRIHPTSSKTSSRKPHCYPQVYECSCSTSSRSSTMTIPPS